MGFGKNDVMVSMRVMAMEVMATIPLIVTMMVRIRMARG